jgi:hypothetical protein
LDDRKNIAQQLGDESKFNQRRLRGEDVAEVLGVSMRKLDRVKKRFVEEGLDAALGRRPSRRHYERKADGDLEARLVALSCTDPPNGYPKWSLRLLADRAVELEYIDSISYETVRRVLKNEIKPWRQIAWVIPSEGNAEFVAAMEPSNPVICMDEAPRQLIPRDAHSRHAQGVLSATTTSMSAAASATCSWPPNR